MTRTRTIGSIGKLDVKQLYCDTVPYKPRDMDWSEGYAERWDVIQPYDYDDFRDTEWNEIHLGAYDYDGMIDDNQPMMNYFYPLPNETRYGGEFTKIDAQVINNLPLCLVYLEDEEEHGLALTGGGMDLSWEICEAYVRLGYLPPFHFSNLPRMSGRGISPRDRTIIRACKRSCHVMIQWATNNLRELMRVSKQ